MHVTRHLSEFSWDRPQIHELDEHQFLLRHPSSSSFFLYLEVSQVFLFPSLFPSLASLSASLFPSPPSLSLSFLFRLPCRAWASKEHVGRRPAVVNTNRTTKRHLINTNKLQKTPTNHNINQPELRHSTKVRNLSSVSRVLLVE